MSRAHLTLPAVGLGRPLHTLVVAGLAAGLLFTAGCKKRQEPPPPQPLPPPQVEVRLQVTGIEPSTVQPNQAVSGRIFGSAFQDGATVSFTGPTEGRGQEVSLQSPNTLEVTIPALPEGSYDVKVTNPDGESSVARSALTVRAAQNTCRQVTVNFDFDSSAIRGDSRSTLDGHMSCYQKLTGPIRVEGHTDERGTVDYNVALGQRRADSVKQYLVSNGVSGSRVTTTSYGEERPIDRASNEVAWAKNRRAEITATE